MKKFYLFSFAALCAAVLFSSCASIVSRSNWPLTVTSDPNGANVEIFDRNSTPVFTGVTPATMTLRSGDGFFRAQRYTVVVNMPGYKEQRLTVNCSVNGWYFGNILIGGLIGMLIVDPATGAMYRLSNQNVAATLEPVDNYALVIKNINELTAEEKENLTRIN